MSETQSDDPKTPPIKPEDAPDSIYGPDGKPRFFAEPGMDRFVAVVMNLAQEIWVQEGRLMALEGTEADPEARENPRAIRGGLPYSASTEQRLFPPRHRQQFLRGSRQQYCYLHRSDSDLRHCDSPR